MRQHLLKIMDLELSQIYGASVYQSPLNTGILSKKEMTSAFEKQHSQNSMGECIYKC